MKTLHTKLIATAAVLVLAASPVIAAEVSRGSEGSGETPRSAPGARGLSERGFNFMPQLEDEPGTRSIELDRGARERSFGTIGRKADGSTRTIPATEDVKRSL